MKQIKSKLDAIEALRRERVDNTLTTRPTPDGRDYAQAGLLIQHSMAALDEGIPNRQRNRVELALVALQEGVADMLVWAKANGYSIEEPPR